MATQVRVQPAPIARPNLLRYALRGDALFSIVTGAISLAAAQPLANLLGIQPALILSVLGAVLVLYGGFLLYTSAQAQINRRVVIAAIILDVLWVVDSAILLVAGWLPLTNTGMWTIGLLAGGVVIFAELKFFGLWRRR
jgi:hypothetical protein